MNYMTCIARFYEEDVDFIRMVVGDMIEEVVAGAHAPHAVHPNALLQIAHARLLL